MTNKKFSQKKSLSKPYFEGSKDEFNRFLSGYSRNLVQRITRKYKAEIGKCEFCGLENEELDSAHIHGKERKLIINKIISKFCKNDIIKINLIEFENQLIKEHDPINEVIKILCKKCHVEYDNKSSKNNSAIKNEKRRKNEMKIGNYVKSTFEILNNSTKLSQKEIGNLQDLVYCKNTFNLSFPVLIKKNLPVKDIKGHNRYYTKDIINGYWLCSQWHERHWDKFLKWEKDINKG